MIKQLDPQNFIDRLRLALANETRTPLEIGAKKQPKMEFLKSIIDVIELLFDNLYSVNEQLYLINTVDKKFSLTDTTYFKFLNTYLKDEYIILKKNRFCVSKIKFIKEVNSLFPDNIKKQFDLFTDFTLKHELSFEDYENFLSKYFLQDGESLLVKKNLDRYGESVQEYVPSSHNLLKKKTVVIKEPDTIKSILPKKSARGLKKNKPLPSKRSVSLGNSSVSLEKVDTSKFLGHTTQKLKSSENEQKLFYLLPGADVNILPNNINIIKNVALFPKEVLGTSFMFSDLNDKKNEINEEYLYLKDLRYIQWLDLKHILLKDGLLIIEGKRSTQVFLSYRYYKGNLYLIEESQWNPDEYRIKDELNREFDENSSLEVLEFEEKLALMEMYPSKQA